jgi:hypothetical protein
MATGIMKGRRQEHVTVAAVRKETEHKNGISPPANTSFILFFYRSVRRRFRGASKIKKKVQKKERKK